MNIGGGLPTNKMKKKKEWESVGEGGEKIQKTMTKK